MAVTIMLPTLPVMADAVGTFEEAVVQYGEQAGNYTYDITAAGEQTKSHTRKRISGKKQTLQVGHCS